MLLLGAYFSNIPLNTIFKRPLRLVFHGLSYCAFNIRALLLVLPFVPLLADSQSWSKRFREFLVTSSILAGVLVTILVVRHYMGDPRANTLFDNPSELGMRVITAPWIGLITTLKASIVFPLDALRHGKAALWIEGLITLFIACSILIAGYPGSERSSSQPNIFFRGGPLMIASAAMFFSPYLYRFIPHYYPPIVDIGRISMLHFPSAIGAALFIGAAIDSLLYRLPKAKYVTLLCCAAYLALLVVFANHVQRSEYARHGRMQQEFAHDVIEQTRDLGDGDIAIVDIETGFDHGADVRPTTPGHSPFWICYTSFGFLKLLNQYPIGWQKPPNLFAFWRTVPTTIQGDAVLLATPPWGTSAQQAGVRDGKFAWLEWVEGRLVRRKEPVIIAGVTLTPKPLDENASIPPPTKFASIYFNLNDTSWPSMEKARNYPQ
jgi:hypothetical protein